MKVHIIYCGGTLGMIEGVNGFEPATDFGEIWQAQFQKAHAMHEVIIHNLTPAIDSSNLRPHHWNNIYTALSQIETDANVLLIHGTDTLSWTAAFFYLANRHHRLIISGSQRPAFVNNSDAHANIDGAFRHFQQLKSGQTAIYFGARLIDAHNSIKFSSLDDAAFVNFLQPIDARDPLTALPPPTVVDENAAIVHLYPSVPIPTKLRAPFIIIEAYGAGNGPDANASLIDWIADARNDGCVIGITSQCPHGGAYNAGYAAGNALIDAGAIVLPGLTTSATFARAHFLAPQDIADSAKAPFWKGQFQ